MLDEEPYTLPDKESYEQWQKENQMSEPICIKVVAPNTEIIPHMHPIDATKLVATMGRLCYASEPTCSDADFVRRRLTGEDKHESVIEHASLSVIFTCTRDNSHEIVRHRLASYSQQSQRYVNYDAKGFSFICPEHVGLAIGRYSFNDNDGWTTPEDQKTINENQYDWLQGRIFDIAEYHGAIEKGKKAEIARQCLPNCTATIIGMTCDLREWRTVFRLRALSPRAQKTTRDLFRVVYFWFVENMPWFVEDLQDKAKNL